MRTCKADREVAVKREISIAVSAVMVIASGCATGPEHHASKSQDLKQSVDRVSAIEEKPYRLALEDDDDFTAPKQRSESTTRQVDHEEEIALPLTQPESILLPAPDESLPTPSSEHDVVMSLETLEQMALSNNPTLIQAMAQVDAASGAAYQAGLYPNPVVGYASDQIGIEGTAGELQGAYVSQEFVTAGKLQLSRAKWSQAACIAETNLSAQYDRVLNDVRIHFYKTLAAQQHVELQKQLLANAKDNMQTHKEMLNLGQTNMAGFLQSEVDLSQNQLNLQKAENNLERAWRNLMAMVGTPDLLRSTLSGSLEPTEEKLDWDSAFHHLLQNSPELIAAGEKIHHDEITVERERVQSIPNILVDVDFGHNFETDNSVAGVTAGIALPIFDNNSGTIDQAQADLNRSRADVKRLELTLSMKLAEKYRDYQTAWQHIQAYQNEMLPKARRAHELLYESYFKRRAAWLDVLLAQRRSLELQQQYVDALLAYRETDIVIRGMLLTGGLTQPPAPLSGGHIDAVPKPR
ncbi:Cobalt-zinc-cadmium resistance protein CzcC precursor [Gimesia alba]|uniref:Cobalt-zinc-cadmium resistance protein CzcC n=1 Tax=Gimesia alba TaxID=2527973 RepID=A0A517RM00_9PLAN|nr:Cobalt-zinc-cadmium resistance protein CzcC precursor [Gimesia alba]